MTFPSLLGGEEEEEEEEEEDVDGEESVDDEDLPNNRNGRLSQDADKYPIAKYFGIED